MCNVLCVVDRIYRSYSANDKKISKDITYACNHCTIKNNINTHHKEGLTMDWLYLRTKHYYFTKTLKATLEALQVTTLYEDQKHSTITTIKSSTQ